ncbi:MAG: hypothetical protein ACRC6M_02355, partial [Microcystaceae cyanobacterium]
YFFVQVTRKEATTPLELAALKAANEINQRQLDGEGICTDLRLLDNEIQCTTVTASEVQPDLAKIAAKGKKALTAAK